MPRMMPYTQEEIDAGRWAEDMKVEQGKGNGVGAMLDALASALRDDMESGADWMNTVATTEFEKKYPRFVTLFNYARRIDWTKD